MSRSFHFFTVRPWQENVGNTVHLYNFQKVPWHLVPLWCRAPFSKPIIRHESATLSPWLTGSFITLSIHTVIYFVSVPNKLQSAAGNFRPPCVLLKKLKIVTNKKKILANIWKLLDVNCMYLYLVFTESRLGTLGRQKVLWDRLHSLFVLGFFKTTCMRSSQPFVLSSVLTVSWRHKNFGEINSSVINKSHKCSLRMTSCDSRIKESQLFLI